LGPLDDRAYGAAADQPHLAGHDTPIGGPDRYPADEAARQCFFALDV
jgi:hypothetical protein